MEKSKSEYAASLRRRPTPIPARPKASNATEQEILQAVRELDIELVLTAHPTEVTRRTLIHKHVQL
ncbi:MAG: hypothetical protein RLZZ300_856, partial [Pseudomonadota bacterium]